MVDTSWIIEIMKHNFVQYGKVCKHNNKLERNILDYLTHKGDQKIRLAFENIKWLKIVVTHQHNLWSFWNLIPTFRVLSKRLSVLYHTQAIEAAVSSSSALSVFTYVFSSSSHCYWDCLDCWHPLSCFRFSLTGPLYGWATATWFYDSV